MDRSDFMETLNHGQTDRIGEGLVERVVVDQVARTGQAKTEGEAQRGVLQGLGTHEGADGGEEATERHRTG